MRILIVEDEKKAAAYLQKGLTEQGFVVDVGVDGREGLQLARMVEYDLIILDVMMPLRDGWSVLQELRGSGKPTPVLFLTARDSADDRVKGLELGADDYIVKPFAFVELLARIRSILRRGPARQPEQFGLADLTLDPVRHKALRNGERLDLSPRSLPFCHSFFNGPRRCCRERSSPSKFGKSILTAIRILWMWRCAACGRRWMIRFPKNCYTQPWSRLCP